ncbi:MAG TPA: metalloregulator ArsR/SmtB family transcription factor [Thiotrichales bacterium]|nr:metalloregulator ArsR/SmtB family transcription factor [Thiotrichales bacterium]
MQAVTIQPETIFRSLADETRLRIIHLMAVTGEEACLCELADSLLEPPYKLSRHLKILRQAGLLSSYKDGRWVYHRLVAEPACLETVYAAVRALPGPDQVYRADRARFGERMGLREDGRCRVGILSGKLKHRPGETGDGHETPSRHNGQTKHFGTKVAS